ncbi:MAG: tRNA (guanosine(46)-N7)-methyltransferase TrmB [Thermoguttaceae bacterium]|nr:tRNA (guanosine(46)-N7)-methyltransferase TrmB [Thermoguttaceae bacterium]MDW8038401.1 tRNA (guanosine(46)-N7)-methyltransferase TrmB [Thermoguttaceae bacterium]
MARPRVRKIDPTLDLSQHYYVLGDLPRPLDLAVLFGRRAPVEVDVGSGKGLFLRQAAAAFPDRDFLGVELSIKYARYSAAQLAKLGLPNAKVIQADVVRFFADWLPDGLLSAVHIYFPDPWWKKRHKKRRIMRESFLRDVERCLEAGGLMHFWTDVQEYFDTTLQLIARCTRLEGPLPESAETSQRPFEFRTHFERRHRLQGVPIYQAVYRKPASHLLLESYPPSQAIK